MQHVFREAGFEALQDSTVAMTIGGIPRSTPVRREARPRRVSASSDARCDPRAIKIVFIAFAMNMNNENDQANRAISTGKLHTLLCFHTRPINVVVYNGSDREHSFSGWFPA